MLRYKRREVLTHAVMWGDPRDTRLRPKGPRNAWFHHMKCPEEANP